LMVSVYMLGWCEDAGDGAMIEFTTGSRRFRPETPFN